MKLRPEQLANHLNRQLLPAYLISGDEPLLLQENVALIIKAAKAAHFLEHRIFQAETHFDWEKFLNDAFTLSLFSAKGIIELRFLGQLPNKAASKALQMYFEQPPRHKLLLMTTEKLDGNAQKASWFKEFDQKGAVIQVWPVEKSQLPAWLAEKARQRGLNFTQEALLLLAEQVEGNLLAAVQALERIKLLCGENAAKNLAISSEQVLKVVSCQAQFNIFDLIETLLSGDLKRAYRIFYLLKDESVEPLFILNMLTKEIRLLASLLYRMDQGLRIDEAIKTVYLPVKKQALLKRVISRFSSQRCVALIQKASQIDCIVKGVECGDSWHALSEFFLEFRGC